MPGAIEQLAPEERRQPDQDRPGRKRCCKCRLAPTRIDADWIEQHAKRVIPRSVRTDRKHAQNADREMIDLGGGHLATLLATSSKIWGNVPMRRWVIRADTAPMEEPLPLSSAARPGIAGLAVSPVVLLCLAGMA